MRKYIKGAVLLGIMSSSTMYGSFEFRTPTSLDWRGTFHWFLDAPENAFWYGSMPGEKLCSWEVRTWSAGYVRNADKAFIDPCNPCNKNKVTTKTSTLAALIFGKEVFRGEEAFTGGTFAGNATTGSDVLANLQILNRNNPFVGFAKITPRFEYYEYGAYWGVDAYRRFGKNQRWYAGFRADIPFRVIDIEQQDDSIEETIGDVVRFRNNTIDDSAGTFEQNDFAARFDFLNTLLIAGANPATNTAFVQYSAANGNVDMAGVQVSGTAADDPAGSNAYAIVSTSGELPIPNPGFKKIPGQVTGSLPADGSTDNGAILFMLTGTDYAGTGDLATDRNAQGQLFFVPRTNDGLELTADALVLSGVLAANFVFSMDADENASDFFKSKGINLFAHERVTALGDLDAEGYVGYGDYATWFGSGVLGLRFPTGKRQENSNKIYLKSTGNNGHVEIKLALDGGWKPYEWFAFEIDAQFHHAFKRTEHRAAAFTGATIKNIGPEICAKVSWSYFLLRTDFNFFHPQNPELGCCFGYELYVKGNDRVCFEQTTATDLFGRTNQPVDPAIYRTRTNSLSNKIHGQFFHRWNFFEFFAGGSQIVAGRNLMKETEAHIGFVKYF